MVKSSYGQPTERIGLLRHSLGLHDILAQEARDLESVLDLLGRLFAVTHQRTPALEALAGFLPGCQECSQVAWRISWP